jgi:hypothetical protein
MMTECSLSQMSALNTRVGERRHRSFLAGLSAACIMTSSLGFALLAIATSGLEKHVTADNVRLTAAGWIGSRQPQKYHLQQQQPQQERNDTNQLPRRPSRAAAPSAQAQSVAQAMPQAFPAAPRHRTGIGSGRHSPNYTIARPYECRHEAVYVDCFLCGKVTEEVRIYWACCQREPEIVSFCNRLLS